MNHNIFLGGGNLILMPATTITTAVTGLTTTAELNLAGMTSLAVFSKLTYGSGGTTAKIWVQTSFDQGTTWVDIVSHAFATATLSRLSTVVLTSAANITMTDGTLADNTVLNGVLGDRLRVKYTTTGTYAGSTSLKVWAVAKN